MKSLFVNRLLDGLANTLIVYALIHTVTMFLYAAAFNNYQIFNGFTILGISLLFPQLALGIYNFSLGGILLAVIFILVLRFLTVPKK